MRFKSCRPTLAATLLSVIGIGLGACDGSESGGATGAQSDPAGDTTRMVSLPRGVSANLPAGWELIRRPINGVSYPAQVFAAASFPVKLGETTPGCRRVPDQSPSDAVLIQVVQYAGRPKPENFPPRERPFRLPKRTYAVHECAGPSYNIVFRDHRRGLQAFVILDRRRVDPRIRRQAIELLNSMRFDSPRAEDGQDSAGNPGSPSPSDQAAPLNQPPPDWTAKMANCPAQIRLTDGPSCKLLARRQVLRHCPSHIGYDVRASGVSCSEAVSFVGPLGGAAGIPTFKRQSERLTRPAVARYSVPFAVRGTGWTCWTGFHPRAGYVQYVCWRGGDVLTFRFG